MEFSWKHGGKCAKTVRRHQSFFRRSDLNCHPLTWHKSFSRQFHPFSLSLRCCGGKQQRKLNSVQKKNFYFIYWFFFSPRVYPVLTLAFFLPCTGNTKSFNDVHFVAARYAKLAFKNSVLIYKAEQRHQHFQSRKTFSLVHGDLWFRGLDQWDMNEGWGRDVSGRLEKFLPLSLFSSHFPWRIDSEDQKLPCSEVLACVRYPAAPLFDLCLCLSGFPCHLHCYSPCR